MQVTLEEEDEVDLFEENDESQDLQKEENREVNRLTTLWKELEVGHKNAIKNKRLQEEASRKFRSNAPPVKSIFSAGASVHMLISSLIDFRSRPYGIDATPIEDNIYEWSVKFNIEAFPEDSPLALDLKKISQRSATSGMSFVEMTMSFTPDLFPFMPPVAAVVRPRFLGFMMGRIAGAKLLQLDYWDPMRPMSGENGVLRAISQLLSEHGRLDVENPRNSPIFYPEGAYSELEYLLLKLTTLSDTQPRANLKYTIEDLDGDVQSRPAASLVGVAVKEEISEMSKKLSSWRNAPGNVVNPQAAGTGYGTGHCMGSNFNANQYLAMARARDAEIEMVLENILGELTRLLECAGSSESEGKSENKLSAVAELERTASQDWLERGKMEVGFTTDELYSVIEESCLVPFLELQLQNESVQDLMARESLYRVP